MATNIVNTTLVDRILRSRIDHVQNAWRIYNLIADLNATGMQKGIVCFEDELVSLWFQFPRV